LAVDNARDKLNTALNALRVALIIDHVPRIVGWRIWDEQMLFHSGLESAVREKNNPSSASIGFNSKFRSWQFKLDDTYEKQINESKRVLDCLFLSPNAQTKLYRRIVRALDWIGSSATRERLDDKIVDICTALEALLAQQHDVKKGEAIALRMMLLYTLLKLPSFDPVQLFEIYEKRSRIVHGSDRDISSDAEYRSAQWIATDVLTKMLAYIQIHNITQHSAFIDSLESDRALLEKLVEFWKPTPYYGSISLFAKNVIENRYRNANESCIISTNEA
jgi:hypothetical protein